MVSEAETGESENEVRISQLEDKCARLARIVSFYRKRDAQSLGECQRWREEAKRLEASQWDLIRQRDCLQKRVEQANKQIWLRDSKIEKLIRHVNYLNQRIYGSSSERISHKIQNPACEQLVLPFLIPVDEQLPSDQLGGQIHDTQAESKPRVRVKHPGRYTLPEHLEVKETVIKPEGDLRGFKCIGKEITEELEVIPARYFIHRIIRYKYAIPEGGVRIAPLPDRPLPKSKLGPGFITEVLANKFIDHIPYYRQIQRLKREGIAISLSTLQGAARKYMELLQILYESLANRIVKSSYLQVDETTFRVLDEKKSKNSGRSHLGYFWVYHSPETKITLFDYQKGRGLDAPMGLLRNFQGFLQSDAYSVYDRIGQLMGISPVGCWAHARREFIRAQDSDPKNAHVALSFIQSLYAVERKAKELGFRAEQRKALRDKESLPILRKMENWFESIIHRLLPKDPLRKAVQYCMKRWAKLKAYLKDGAIEIDNNPVENQIRPVALGRKNYLFSGSHESAQHVAMMYTFMGTCKTHNVNPKDWLRYVIENISEAKVNEIEKFFPENFHKLSLTSPT